MRILKKTLLALLLIANSVFAEEKILNVYSWSSYLSEDIIQKFEQETGIQVNHSTYVNNEVLYAKLKANPDSGYDVIIPSSYLISRMLKQGLIRRIDKSKLKNLKNVNPLFLNKEYDLKIEYSIPYLWTSTGIVLNKKYISNQKITAWQDLWKPEFKDQLLVLDDTREIFSVALMTLGYSVNDTNPEHIKDAFKRLKALIANIKLFNTEVQRSIYLDEDINIGMGWNGDIYLAKEENPNLEFIYPKEGFIIALDCLAIPKGAKHVENAHLFIDFVLRAEIAKEIALNSGFSSANLAAMKLLPEKIKTNKILYPNSEVLKHAQFLDDVGEAAPLYEKYFERLKLEE